MDLGLDGVPAAVAGASRGLGYAVAMGLAREGARVAICARHREALEGAAAEIHRATGTFVVPIVADFAAAGASERFVADAAAGLGGLQVVVANAGGPPPGPASQFDEAAWASALQLNLLSSARMAVASLPYLRKQPWGRIVFITSVSVRQAIRNLPLSSAARSGATAYAKTLAGEVAAEGITVNCLMPGYTLTDRVRSLAGAPPDAGPDHSSFATMVGDIPAGRLGLPEEFAAVAAFFCSARSSYLTGTSLQVDGGWCRGLL